MKQHLKKIQTTEFHLVLGQSFINQADSLVNSIDDFYKVISKKIDIKAFYFGMNEFDINTDIWYIDAFSYDRDDGLHHGDMEWLSDVTRDTMTSKEFTLTGFEKLQNAFENMELDNENLQDARDWSEQIIIVRFMELMWIARLKAKETNLSYSTIANYFTEHSYDFILKSEN